ncbi:A-Kinase Anchor Protein 13 [Manis pentadactyla]|nr:A-Kinase Anchor Protein 13 [Manis pentadactyla]
MITSVIWNADCDDNFVDKLETVTLLLAGYRENGSPFDVMFFCPTLHIMTFEMFLPITVYSVRISIHGAQLL